MDANDFSNNDISFFGDFALANLKPRVNHRTSSVNHCNLEAPFTGFIPVPSSSGSHPSQQRMRKVGPILTQLPLCASSEDFSTYIFSLANNHAMDLGWDGLNFTIETLGRGRVHGAGETSVEARKPLLLSIGGQDVALVACSDNFFGGQNPLHPGIATLQEGEDWVYELITKLSAEGKFTIVIFHGGLEMFPLPSPALRGKLQSWVRAGAASVIVNHPHIPLPSEQYLGSWIHYGLGNYLVDPSKWQNAHPHALLSKHVRFTVDDSGLSGTHSFLALEQSSNLEVRVFEADLDISSDLENWHQELLGVIQDPLLHQEVFELLGRNFIENFSGRQVLLGSIGLKLARSKRISSVLSSGTPLGTYLREGFGPHLTDLFSPAYTRDLIMGGIEAIYSERRYSQKSLDVVEKILTISQAQPGESKARSVLKKLMGRKIWMGKKIIATTSQKRKLSR